MRFVEEHVLLKALEVDREGVIALLRDFTGSELAGLDKACLMIEGAIYTVENERRAALKQRERER
jgi:hypothetical protein